MNKKNKSKQELLEEISELQKKVDSLTRLKSRLKTSEKELKESKAELVSILHSLPDTIIIFDKDGKYINIPDSKLSNSLLRPKKELLGKYIRDFFSDEKAAFFLKNIKKALKTSKPVYLEYNLEIKGKTHWLSATMSPIDKSHVILLARDITEKKLGEEKINETLSLLNATLESTADGILVVNSKGIITGLNQRFIKMWGIPNELVKFKSDKKLLEFVMNQLKEPEQFYIRVNWLYNHPDKESYDILEFTDGRAFERFSIPQKLNNKIV